MQNKNSKLNKVVKGTGIAVKVVLVLLGLATAAFFAWIAYSLYTLLLGAL
ncbi:MAG: hypothetical protein K2M47_06710 [Clostridiales bacterium]|nr:hypothetical protein [Clostridiales bacterium]